MNYLNIAKKIIANFAILFIFLSTSSVVQALEFETIERFPNGLAKITRISGEIQVGDYEKFVRFLNVNSPVIGVPDSFLGMARIQLESNGGNVLEAMKIATKLKTLMPLINVEGNCVSSCLLLWMSGSQRFVGLQQNNGRIGIHRPTLPAEELRKLSNQKAESLYKDMNSRFKEFVLEQGLPLSIYEKLIATSSLEVYWLNESELKLIGSSPPYFVEKIFASCLNKNDAKYMSNNSLDMAKCVSKLSSKDRILAVDALLYKPKSEKWNFILKSNLEED